MKNLIQLTAVALLIFGCAKNRDVERVRDGDRENTLLKQSFLGAPGDSRNRATWLAKLTVVDTSDSPAGNVFVGYQGDVKIGYFDFNETKMQFRSLNGLNVGKETQNVKNPVLLSWDIDHMDFTLDERDGQTTNQEIKDNFKTWQDRRYFKVKWNAQGHNDTQMFPISSFSQFRCWTPISRRRIENSMKIEPDHIGFKVEVVYQQHPACASSKQWNQGDFNFTVTYMYSFRKDKPSDYKPKVFANEQDPARYKYGHFQTVRQILNPKNGRPHNIFMENRWAQKTQHFYFVKGFPEKYKWMWKHAKSHTVFGQTNKLLKNVGAKLKFEIHDYNYNHKTGKNDGPEREFGDLRYSFVNFIDQLEAGGTPFGYGPSDTHPWTGEIIAANTMVWTGFLGYYIDLMEQIGNDAVDENGKPKTTTLFSKLEAVLDVKSVDPMVSSWNQSKGIGKLFKEMAQETRYGATFYNSYTEDNGQFYVPTVYEYHGGKSSGHFDPNGGFIAHISEIVSHPLDQKIDGEIKFGLTNGKRKPKVVNPYDSLGMEWFDKILNSSDSRVQQITNHNGFKDIGKLFSNMLKTLDKNYAGPALNLQDLTKQFYNERHREIEHNKDGHCIIDMEDFASGLAGFIQAGKIDLKDKTTREDFLNTVLYRVSIHEFGHNLNLRHNFYGSVDTDNFRLGEKLQPWSNNLKVIDKDGKVLAGERVQISSSVMDYLRLEDEINTPWAWEDYDVAAILDSYHPKKFDDKGELFLFCTDEHTVTSAICNRHDLGSTPTQILMSQIRSYDERYLSRNTRFGRAYWDSRGYARRIYFDMMSMKEFLPMWRSAFAEDLLRDKMYELNITAKPEQDRYLEEMNRELRTVMKISMGFYQAVMQQSQGERDYRSVYDGVTGALQQVGIISDKIFAMMFLAGDNAIFYNPNRIMLHNSYLTYATEPGLAAFSDRIWRNIVTTRNGAMEPWFINFARFLYAKSATNYYNRYSSSLIDSMKVVKVEDYTTLESLYGVEMKPSLSSLRIRLPKSDGGTFSKDEEVVIVHVNGSYYMTSSTGGNVTYALFQEALEKLVGSGAGNTDPANASNSLQDFKMDVLELHWLYELATSGSL